MRAALGANRLFANSSFRLGLLYGSVFAASAAILLATIYWASTSFMARQTEQSIATEIDLLQERYRSAGLQSLVALIETRIGAGGDLIYIVSDPVGRHLAGNLSHWPNQAADSNGWISFDLRNPTGTKSRLARARTYRLAGGLRLLVGRDLHELESVQNLLLRAIGVGLAVTVVLAIGGAALLSRTALKRVESIHRASREIMSGDLSRRIEVSGSGDDFDRLAISLNQMLDRIEILMEDVRRVSDNIAHDLRTPLTRLRGTLEALAETSATDPNARSTAADALKEADRLLATFNALLRIARIENGGPATSSVTSRIDLATLVRDAAELYEPIAEAAGVALHTTISLPTNTLTERPMDRDLVFQTLINLLDNAIKFSPKKGRVMFGVRESDGRLEVTVSDMGPGVPPVERERIFTRFYRTDASRHCEGNGLGLSLVAAVARRFDIGIALQDTAGPTTENADRGPGLSVVLDFGPTAPRHPAGPADAGSSFGAASAHSAAADPIPVLVRA